MSANNLLIAQQLLAKIKRDIPGANSGMAMAPAKTEEVAASSANVSPRYALFNAVLDNNPDKVTELVDASKGELLVEQTAEGYTPKELAQRCGYDKVTFQLTVLEGKYFPSKTYTEEMWRTLKSCPLAEFKMLVKGHNINPNYGNKKLTELLFAIYVPGLPDYELKMKFLLNERGGNINLRTNATFRNTLLSILIINEQRKEAFIFLNFAIQRKGPNPFDPNKVDSNKRTILMLAIAIGNLENFIVLLLNAKEQLCLNLNLQDKDGFTALHLACIARDLHTMALLVMHGVDTKIRDNKGRLAQDLLEEKESAEYKILMDSVSINIKRDTNSVSNYLSTTYLGLPALPIFTKAHLQQMAKEEALPAKTLSTATLRALGEAMCIQRRRFEKHFLLSDKTTRAYSYQELYCLHLTHRQFYPLSAPEVRKDREYIDQVRQSFSGVTLEEFVLSPARTAAAKQIFTPNVFLELEQCPRLLPLLTSVLGQFKGFKPRGTTDITTATTTIASLIFSYAQPNVNQLVAPTKANKRKKKKNQTKTTINKK
jgi:hypothetical protein